jgi:bacillithiol biosynthesis cysteine-adding enzyme BshC
VRGEPHLLRSFNGGFQDPAAFREKAREVDRRFHRDGRARALSFLAPAPPAAADALRRFVDDGGYFVTTGQQPGLLGGPLYALYKALSAVKLARVLEAMLGRPVLPVFWVASEDHDWAEVDHTHVLDVHNEVRTIRIPAQEGGLHRPLHRIRLAAGVEEGVATFIEALPRSDFGDRYLTLIREAVSPGVTLPDSFRSLLGGILSHLPLLFVDGAHPALKAASLPVLFRELEEAGPQLALLSRSTSRLEREGYHVQVPILEGGVNLFFEGPQGRERLFLDGDGFRLNRSGARLSAGEIRDRAGDDPTLLSPNVFLRPVVESTLLPTLAYVAGPGELAYYAQLSDFFEAHGVRMPVIVPRHSVTLVEAKVGKVLEKFRLSPDSLDRPYHELASEIARDEVPVAIREALGEFRGTVGRSAGTLAKAVQELDPTLKGPVTTARNAAFAALDEAERKVVQAVKRQNEIALEQLEKAQRHLFPLGKPQERVVNPFYFLARYGPELVDALLEAFTVDLELHSR